MFSLSFFSLAGAGVCMWLGGYSLGRVHGYDQCDQDQRQIETEMNGFWKEVEHHANHPIVRIHGAER